MPILIMVSIGNLPCCAIEYFESSTRIEGMFMDLGTAAGIAAALAIQSGVQDGPGSCPKMALQDTKVTAVQNILEFKYQQRIHGPI